MMDIEQCGNGSSVPAKGRAKATRVLERNGISRASADDMSADAIEAKLKAKGVDESTIDAVVGVEKQRQAEENEAIAAKVSAKIDNENFQYKGNVSAKEVNALLQQIRERQAGGNTSTQKAEKPQPKTEKQQKAATPIKKYQDFENAITKTYERLNKELNSDGLVPIYEVRRRLGNRVSRSQFDNWLMEMQASDKIQLMGGSLSPSGNKVGNAEQIRDSVTTELSGLRTYMQRL
jgi:hypothetical protein